MVEKIKQALEQAYAERENQPVGRSNTRSLSAMPRSSSQMDSMANLLGNAKQQFVDIERFEENRILAGGATNKHQESYRLLRTQVHRLLKDQELTTVGITSPGKGEGKSLTSLNLAISLARNPDMTVVLLDGNIEAPQLNELLNFQVACGFIDFLQGNVELENVILKLNLQNLWLIPGRETTMEMNTQVSLNQFEELRDKLPVNNVIVIVDLPPVLENDSTLALASRLDGIILVVEEGVSVQKEVSLSIELLKQSNLIGSVLNKAVSF